MQINVLLWGIAQNNRCAQNAKRNNKFREMRKINNHVGPEELSQDYTLSYPARRDGDLWSQNVPASEDTNDMQTN